MDWISDEIALGNAVEAKDRVVVEDGGFRSILTLNGDEPERSPASFGVAQRRVFRLIDGAGNDPRHLRLAIEALETLAHKAEPLRFGENPVRSPRSCTAPQESSAAPDRDADPVPPFPLRGKGLFFPRLKGRSRSRNNSILKGPQRPLRGRPSARGGRR